MDRTQAAEINRHMRKAANAIDRASQIISALDAADREMLAAPLEKIVLALHFELLRAVYLRYPDLRPPAAGRSIKNTVRLWKKSFFRSPRLISIGPSLRPSVRDGRRPRWLSARP